jgi:DNA-binding transcriptional regulator YiaG
VFILTPERVRTIRERLALTPDEFGARLFRTSDGGDAVRAMEAGTRPVTPMLALAISALSLEGPATSAGSGAALA